MVEANIGCEFSDMKYHHSHSKHAFEVNCKLYDASRLTLILTSNDMKQHHSFKKWTIVIKACL